MILHFSQIFLTDGFTFICDYHAFLSSWGLLLGAPGDAALGQVVDRNLDGHMVTGQNTDIVQTKLTRNVSDHRVTVGQLHFEGGVGQSLLNDALKLNDIILRQKNPSLSCSVL